jgi:hypothetical protein
MHRKWLTALLAFGWSAAILSAGPMPQQEQEKADQDQAKRDMQAADKARAQVANDQARAAQQALNAPSLPGGLTLQRLAQMPPEERAATLANLPPARQRQIEDKVQNFLNLPQDEQARILRQLEHMQALPPDKREDVRQSLREYQMTPQPRKVVITRELNYLATLTDEQRSNYMSKPAFRSRFAESEIQMMNNLRGIVP